MLQGWLQSLCTAASTNTAALRVPLYDFLETAAYYPPDEPVTTATNATKTTTQHSYPAGAAGAAATAVATPAAAATADGVPYATATPYAEALPTAAGRSAAAPFTPPHLPPEVPRMAKPDSAASGSGGSGGDWAVPLESQEASDLKLAMTGPDASGRLTGAQAAEALRTGTGAAPEDLRAVWELSDIDRDGMLDRDEVRTAFCCR